jgi:hypothetical protein
VSSTHDEALRRLTQQVPATWKLDLYELAGEASGGFIPVRRRHNVGQKGAAEDPERARAEAARRARGKLRRYCAANMLTRLGTLTYAGEGCHDPRQLRSDVSEFFRRLKRAGPGVHRPYAWVPEWHSGGHGLHVHFAIGRYVPRSMIDEAWGRGFVHIKLLSNVPVSGVMRWSESRVAARYLSKYVTKAFVDGGNGLHRYEVAQGFRPERSIITGTSSEEVVDAACERMGQSPAQVWSSSEVEDWKGAPALWLSWDG